MHPPFLHRLVRLLTNIPIKWGSKSELNVCEPNKAYILSPASIAYLTHAAADHVIGPHYGTWEFEDRQNAILLVLHRWQVMIHDLHRGANNKRNAAIGWKQGIRSRPSEFHRYSEGDGGVPMLDQSYQELYIGIPQMQMVINSRMDNKRRVCDAKGKKSRRR